MTTTKPFKTIDEQIQLLQSSNLTILESDMEKTRNFLLNNNYYRISGYSLTLRKNEVFHHGITIDHLIQIYEGDKMMRHILLSNLEIIETRLKSLISHLHAEKYGPLGYLDINTFNCVSNNKVGIHVIQNYIHITRKASQQKNSNYDSERFIQHHIDNKNGEFPFWVYIELLTISDTSKLYTILDEDLQRNIAAKLGFTVTNSVNIVQNHLHCMTILRNICAHGGRLYNRLFIRKPTLSISDKNLLRKVNGKPVLNRLFSYILVIKSLIDENEFKQLKEQLLELDRNYPLAHFKNYGFPDNWKIIL